MPAAARAAESATAMWPSTRVKIAGWPALAASMSCRVGVFLSGQRVWSHPPPVSHCPRRRLLRRGANAGLHLGKRLHTDQVHRQSNAAAHAQMCVRVVEAGHHEGATQVDDLCGRTLEAGLHLRIRAGAENLAMRHGNGRNALGACRFQIDAGENIAVEVDCIRRGMRLRRSHRGTHHHSQ